LGGGGPYVAVRYRAGMDIARRGIRIVEHQNFSIEDPDELLFGPEEEELVEGSWRPLTFVGVVLAILPLLLSINY